MVGRPRILDAIDALKGGDRRGAAALLKAELATNTTSGDGLIQLSRLALHIGEIELGVDAARRVGLAEPTTVGRLLDYCGTLVSVGRSAEAVALIGRMPETARNQPAVLHLSGTIASEMGDFERAEACLRAALADDRRAPQSWFALSMVKTFAAGDPDLAAMERVAQSLGGAGGPTQAQFHYALAKAYDDIGDIDRAFAHYAQGARFKRTDEPYDAQRTRAFGEGLMRDFTPTAMQRLKPSRFERQRAIFVNGLPRSGTTLTEQILVSHSQVSDGAEVNLLRAALIPTINYGMANALAFDARGGDDPWGDVARDYHAMLAMRFRTPGLVVDKTLSQSMLMGLLLHSMPEARVIWMRRNPADVALSAYRSYFSSWVPWSWSWEDIAHQVRLEDELFAHWTATFGERILVVPYEEMVREPQAWIPRLLAHAGLPDEPQVYEPHKTQRGVRTASVKQVRSPISTSRIGAAERYRKQMQPFFDAYYG